MLRIVSQASSVEAFTQIFGRFCDRESIFIVTRSPKEIGTRTRFTINLSNGQPLMSGHGEVIESYRDRDNPLGRPGMRVRFLSLDAQSRGMIDRLLAAKATKAGLSGAAKPASAAVGTPRKRATGDSIPSLAFLNQPQAAQAPSASESRASGSSLILPANPFGELPDASLEAFVECTMYEDNTAAAEQGSEDNRNYASNRPYIGPETDPSAVLGSNSSAAPGDHAGNPWQEQSAHVARPELPLAPPRAETHAPDSGPGPNDISTQLVCAPESQSRWRIAAITGVLSAFVGLGIGYLLWGNTAPPANVISAGERSAAQRAAAAPTASAPDGAVDPSTVASKQAATSSADPTTQVTASAATTPPVALDDRNRANGDGAEAGPGGAQEIASEPSGELCEVAVTSEPSRASVSVEGRRLGKTPLQTKLPCGETELVFERSRYQTTTEVVTLTAGSAMPVAIRLRRPRTTLEITSTPSGARVIVGQEKVGRTPTSVEVPGYVRTKVVVRKSGYRSFRKRVYPKPPSMQINASLSPRE